MLFLFLKRLNYMNRCLRSKETQESGYLFRFTTQKKISLSLADYVEKVHDGKADLRQAVT